MDYTFGGNHSNANYLCDSLFYEFDRKECGWKMFDCNIFVRRVLLIIELVI